MSSYRNQNPRKIQVRTAPAYHPLQLVTQPRGGLDVDLPADLDDQREPEQTATRRSAVSVRSGALAGSGG